jgi:hypothetical protein
LKICFGCADIGTEENIKKYPNLEWICQACDRFPDLIKFPPEHDKDFGKTLSRGYRKRQQRR